MRVLLSAACGLVLVGCATAPVPAARPLTQAHIETMGPTRVVVAENNYGVMKSWFMTDSSAAGASYGLVGALVTVTMDAIINAGPSRRAREAADEVAQIAPAEEFDTSLVTRLQQQIPGTEVAVAAVVDAALDGSATPTEQGATTETPAIVAEPVQTSVAAPSGVTFSEVATVQKLSAPDAIDDAVEISTSYTLSEDSSVLRVMAYVTYQSPQTPYVTPYAFEGSVPRAEQEGPAYRNTFTYYSDQLPAPTLTPELRDRLIASVQQGARDEAGNLPVEGTTEYRAMERELENARDDELTKSEIAIFLTREWLRDDAALLRQEIAKAHDFIARYVALDLNSTAVPSLDGTDQRIETMADERTVRRIGAGVVAGSYVSSPGGVGSFSTYGNAVAISRSHANRADALRDAARAERRASR
ncbi:MAG: hypothetical protein H7124_07350 [Phycisphaerales bacterium]|nr:hypothetical protein [Hyphomonadaceae bacterium]